MDRRTAAIYESGARSWIARRDIDAPALRRLRELAAGLPRGARVADLGCGPGWFAAALRRRGLSAVGLDLTAEMLRAARAGERRGAWLRGDLARLPFARESLDAAWAKNSYLHLPFAELAPALADLHGALRPGAPVTLSFLAFDPARPARALAPGVSELRARGERGLSGRLFTSLAPDAARDLLEGAGFRVREVANQERLWLRATRARALPDSVRPGLRALVVGLNPSPAAAATGIAFAGANNRFWPAARRAGWVTRERDRAHALARGIGFTDLVKRVTPGAGALRPAEYRRGLARLQRLVERYRPRSVVFVGLAGFRHAVQATARPGALRGGFAGRPAYLLPSTSGRNARVSLAELARHLRRAASLGG
ncbi:MAG TPA: methyltransferase domain-containing protein [Myxococcota bacterium]|nr:methyltransferase domain-containing protein [Myxococcota bacterium]